jgi:hypothetical protein
MLLIRDILTNGSGTCYFRLMIEGSGPGLRTNGSGSATLLPRYKFTVVCRVDEASPTWHADAAVSPALVNAGALVLAGVALALVDVRLAARPREPLRNRAQIYIHTFSTVKVGMLQVMMEMKGRGLSIIFSSLMPIGVGGQAW